ncbi:MAG: hypothetical protein E7188_00355 [Erysipelotrichaceae bacterium]|nr:hypothetical protein [Erysipelotrichaceae bacterium]
MNINDCIHGFRIVSVREAEDIRAQLVEAQHEKTGAKLIWLKREEVNKTFAIAFRTIPEDDTGVFHILEHCVLNGSDKYPVRDPFVDLLKSSMQTFLNAMTYPDKTMFPVSSRNAKDFHHLVGVYLDAVFHPLIYRNPNIFRQEGWHYEIHDPAEAPVYNGVVYNEMKGAFSSVDETIISELNRMLFGNCYQYVSGGDPEKIPGLSYEAFLAAHRRYYHPSNARIILDGDLDIEETLAQIASVLDEYEYSDPKTEIPLQQVRQGTAHTVYHEAEDGQTVQRTNISFANLVGTYQDIDRQIGWSVLAGLLVGSNEAPLKKALLARGLVQDAELDVVSGLLQPYWVLTARNTEPERLEEIKEVIRQTVADLCREGLNTGRITAILNQMEFRYCEPSEPAGVIFADDILKSWLYDGDPMLYLNRRWLYQELRKRAAEGWFEELLMEGLGDPDSAMCVTVIPSTTLAKERADKEAQLLADIKAGWGEETARYVAETEALEAWQNSEDSPEAHASLPKLDLKDVDPFPLKYEPVEKTYRYVPILLYPEQNSGVVYFNLYFSLAGLRKEELPYVSMYARMLGDLATTKHTLEELTELRRGNIGALSFGTAAVVGGHDRKSALPYLMVSCSVLKQNLNIAVDLILEIMQETVFDRERVREILSQTVESCRQDLIGSGHAYAVIHSRAGLTSAGTANEWLNGFTAMQKVTELYENYDTAGTEFLNDTDLFREILWNKNRLDASMTGEENLPELKRLIDALPVQDFTRCTVRYPLDEVHRDGIAVPAPVAYSGIFANVEEAGAEYSPVLDVIGHILTYDYLWNEVRVKNGAYGTGFNVSLSGNIGVYSFRDPHPEMTVNTAQRTGNYLKNFMGDEELPSYIIGTIAAEEPLITPGRMQEAADIRYLCGIDYEERRERRAQMLGIKAEEIREAAETVENALQNARITIVGSEETLQQCGVDRILRLSSRKTGEEE